MKVKVSYTMNYDEVPSLVGQITQTCIQKLREHGKTQLNYHNLDKLVQDVSRIQEDIALVHDQLGDCVSMLAGYEQAKTPSPPPLQESDFVFPPSEDLTNETTE
tara:strand:+ start:333 stop:644 length:312 start_codon:yes stop_codon:yes gene_type:complete